MSAESRHCPRCGGDDLEYFTEEYRTGVVAPDGYEQTETANGLLCQACEWRGEEDELVQDSDSGFVSVDAWSGRKTANIAKMLSTAEGRKYLDEMSRVVVQPETDASKRRIEANDNNAQPDIKKNGGN